MQSWVLRNVTASTIRFDVTCCDIRSAQPVGSGSAAAQPIPAPDLLTLSKLIGSQTVRGGYLYTLFVNTLAWTGWPQAQLMCENVPGFPGTLAMMFTAEDFSVLSSMARDTGAQLTGMWVGAADFLSPGSPYWTSTSLRAGAEDGADQGLPAGGPFASWLNASLASNSTAGAPARCGVLNLTDGTVRPAPCNASYGFVCMSLLGQKAHVELAELSGDGLPDIVAATQCPYQPGASLLAAQQASAQTDEQQAGSRPVLMRRTCGDGIPFTGREECDLGGDNAAGGLCLVNACTVRPLFSVLTSASEAYVVLSDGTNTIRHSGTNLTIYAQARGYRALAADAEEPLMLRGFSPDVIKDGFAAGRPAAIHDRAESRFLPGTPFQYRAYLRTGLSASVWPNWTDVETAAPSDASFRPTGTTCGCSITNPGGQPVNLTVEQQFDRIMFSWIVGSACESAISVTRGELDPVGLETNVTTVAQLSIGLSCNQTYKPAQTEIDEDIVRDGLRVGVTYRYCVGASSSSLDVFHLDANNPTSRRRFVSEPVCRDVKIKWAGKITGEVRTRTDSPVPGARLTARIEGTPHVVSSVADDSGSYSLLLQADVSTCDPVLAPERCLSQLVRLTATQRTRTPAGRILRHVFSINGRMGGTQVLSVQHTRTLATARIIDESALPVTGHVRWPGSSANSGAFETRGCPLPGARVCATNARDNSTISCDTSDADGAFSVAAGIGSVVILRATYDTHTFMITYPPDLEVDAQGAFEVSTPVSGIDVRDTTTRVLSLAVVGGRCAYELGRAALQFTALGCDAQSTQLAADRKAVVGVDVTGAPTPITTFTVAALPWAINFVELEDPIPGLNAQAVLQYFTITNQLSRFVNLTSDAPSNGDTAQAAPTGGVAPPPIVFTFYAPVELSVDICRQEPVGPPSFCGAYSLQQRCNKATADAAIQRVYDVFQPPDSALVQRDVVTLRTAGEYAARIRLYELYGRRVCDDVTSSVLVQDGISGRDSPCSAELNGCIKEVAFEADSNRSSILYPLVPAAPNFSPQTAYALPLTVVVAQTNGWPARSSLIYAVVEGKATRAGTGYIEVPIPVPLLILRDPPGDGSYATLESSVTSTVKLSMSNRDDVLCDGPGSSDMWRSLGWSLINAIPFGVFSKASKLRDALKEANTIEKTVKEAKTLVAAAAKVEKATKAASAAGKAGKGAKAASAVKKGGVAAAALVERGSAGASKVLRRQGAQLSLNLQKSTAASVKALAEAKDIVYEAKMLRIRQIARQVSAPGIKGIKTAIKAYKFAERRAPYDSADGKKDAAGNPQAPDPDVLGRGALYSEIYHGDGDLYEDLLAAMDIDNSTVSEDTMDDLIGNFWAEKEDTPIATHLLLARAIDDYVTFTNLTATANANASQGQPLLASPVAGVQLPAITLAFAKDAYGMAAGSKGLRDRDSQGAYGQGDTWELNPDLLMPKCARNKFGIGYDMDYKLCVGLGAMMCQPVIKDHGIAGMLTERSYANSEEAEDYYKITVSRAEGFSTSKVSTPEMSGPDADMILAPTFAIMFTLSDSLALDPTTCTATTTTGIPGWDLRQDMDATAWHSVWHITNVILPDLERLKAAEEAKPATNRNVTVLSNLQSGILGWKDVLSVYRNLTDMALKDDGPEVFPGYQPGQLDANGLVQPEVEGVWQDTLADSEFRSAQGYEGRGVENKWLEEDRVWKQGYFEGDNALQRLMLRTQDYLDRSGPDGNLVTQPNMRGMGGVVAGKQLDAIQQRMDKEFTKVSFSGGGSGYWYRLSTHSTLTTKIKFGINFKDLLGFFGEQGGGVGLWLENVDEGKYALELEFDSTLLKETERQRNVTFYLSDKDAGDAFLVKVKPDPAFGTPVFQTLAGRSRCPHEPGTLSRHNVSVRVADGSNSRLNVKEGEEVRYLLAIDNASDTDEMVEFALGPDLASNSGLQLSLLGAPWVSPVPYWLPGPKANAALTAVAATCAPGRPTAASDIVARSTCDGGVLARTSLTVACFSACPAVEWPAGWPPLQPLVLNASDAQAGKPLTLTLFNPLYTNQKLRTHPRLTAAVGAVVVEVTSPARDGGVWRPILQPNGTAVNFKNLEDPSYGFATHSWTNWATALADGSYLLRWVVVCDSAVGGGADSRIEGPAVSLLVDRVRPVPLLNSLWPSMTYLPGDSLTVEYSEPLDCRSPGLIAVQATYNETYPTNRQFVLSTGPLLATSPLLAACEGRTLVLSWNPLNWPYAALLANRTITVAVGGVRDMAGNTLLNSTRFSFFMGAVRLTNATNVTLNIALGPVTASGGPARRLLAAATHAASVEHHTGAATAVDRAAVAVGPAALAAGGGSGLRALGPDLEQAPIVSDQTAALAADISAMLQAALAEEGVKEGAQGSGGAAAGAVAAASQVLYDRLRDRLDIVVDVSHSGPGGGHAAADAASLLASRLRDPASALSAALRGALGPVRAVDAPLPLELQLFMQASDEELQEARAAGRRLAAATVLPLTLPGGFLGPAAGPDAMHDGSSGSSKQIGGEVPGATQDGGEQRRRGQSGKRAMGAWLGGSVQYGSGGLVAAVALVNSAVLVVLLVMWAARRVRAPPRFGFIQAELCA
ncbi:hypothetical protein HYH03_015331 [Edaphochlamys debaryana]|uniref:C-type lectin domain-containing protein n=1 Tax=Edaphochlamys debaryana TaxID=47281 RepID=A0A835XL01_9CHLO|nr:hypothetical protein HYH03_015331 [Edaphochlamys debaryana]|eukprot:KAG2486018.1 hypothetical protein HYH03_015331 [Edaphochlamys debaryana]